MTTIEILGTVVFACILIIWVIESDRQSQDDYIAALHAMIDDQDAHIQRMVEELDRLSMLIINKGEGYE